MEVENGEITGQHLIDNPVMKKAEEEQLDIKTNHQDGQGLSAGRLIPPVLNEANFFVTRHIGDGLKRNLEGLGITVHTVRSTDPKEVVASLIVE